MRKRVLLSVGFMFVLIGVIGIAAIHSLRANVVPSSVISATTIFLGYTNDPIEGRLASFTFSNVSPVSIQREYFYGFDFQTTTGWVDQGTCQFQPKSMWSWLRRLGPVLRPGEGEVVAIPAPFTNCWRVCFPFVLPENTLLRIAIQQFPTIQDHGLLKNYDNPYRAKYYSYSKEIAP
jgi:hypothetical protein